MELRFLGTSAGTPSRHRNVSSLALRREDGLVWIFDCGEGTQQQILRSSIKPSSIDRIFLTHLHGDHSYGLFGLISALAVHGRGRRPLAVVGPKGLRDMLTCVLRCSHAHFAFPLEIEEIDGADWQGSLDGWQIQARPLQHRAPCFGYALQEPPGLGRLNRERAEALGIPPGPERGRLVRGESITLADGRQIHPEMAVEPAKPGRRIVILGDTSDSRAIYEAGAGADILVHEATFTGDLEAKAREWGHSTAAMAGDCARDMGVAHLVLTHFSSRYGDHGEDWQRARATLIAEAADRCPGVHVHAAEDFAIASLARRADAESQPALHWRRDEAQS
ncbi:MAG: ribonuclease Z [Planctomycetota bacterium]|nr:MAG: ribonuclease Z [Planctomycetota bacterium]